MLTKFDRRKDRTKHYFAYLYKDLMTTTLFGDHRVAKCIRELGCADFIDVEHGGKNNPSEYHTTIH